MPIPASVPSQSPGVAESRNSPIGLSPGFELGVIEVKDESELVAQLKRPKPGQFAVVTVATTWCPACRRYAPHFEQYAENARGAHLFILTKDETLVEKFGIRYVPTVLAIRLNKSGDRFEYTTVAERDQLGENLLDRVANLASNWPAKYSSVKLSAPSSVVASFDAPSDEAPPPPAPTAADIEANVVKYRALVLKSTGQARINSVPGYLSAVRQLDKIKMLEEIRAWSEIFKGCMDSSCGSAIDDLYTGARDFWMEDKVIGRDELSPILREDFNSSNPVIRYMAAIDYYFMIHLLNSSEADQVANSVRLMFADGNAAVRLAAVNNYTALIQYRKITKTSELADGASALRRLLLDPKPAICEAAAMTYASILERLPKKEADEELRSACRMTLGDIGPRALGKLRYAISSVIGKYKLKLSCQM